MGIAPDAVQLGESSRRAVLLAALRNRRLLRVVAGFFVFNIVEWATWIALLVWAYDHGGVRGSSVVALAQLVPAAILAPMMAALTDRLPRGVALGLGYAVQGLFFLATGAALARDAPFAAVAGLAAVAAVGVSMTRPVHNALIPELSDSTAELTAGNAASGSVEAAAILVGPLLSSLLIGPAGAGGVLLVMGSASMLSVLLTVRLGVPARPPRPAGTGARARSRGLEVVRDPVSRVLALLVAAEYVLIGMMDILIVVLALDLLGMAESGPGLLNAALGVGGLLGAGLTFVLVGRQRLALGLVAGGVVAGVALALAALAGTTVAAVACLAASGAGKVLFDVTTRTLVQRLLPERLLTAVFAMQEVTIMGGLAVGSLLAPGLVEVAGGRGAFVVAGVFLPLLVLCLLRRLRRLDDDAAVPQDILGRLRAVPVLAVLRPRVLDRLAREAHPVQAPAGTALVTEGDLGDRFYVIESGSAEVTKEGEFLRELGPGSWFGELALLRDAPRSATVRAHSDMVLHALDRDAFLATVAGVPSSMEASEDYARRTYQ